MIEWIINNWSNILEIWMYIIGIASIVVKLTPTLKDDHILKEIVKFTGKYIAMNHEVKKK